MCFVIIYLPNTYLQENNASEITSQNINLKGKVQNNEDISIEFISMDYGDVSNTNTIYVMRTTVEALTNTINVMHLIKLLNMTTGSSE